MKIFLNPGHAPDGDPDPGACGFGQEEWKIALDISKLIKPILENKGIEVKIFQSDSLEDICYYANSGNYDLFVSIHCNAFNGEANGVETLYYPGSYKSEKCANYIQNKLVKQFSTLTNRGLKERPNVYVLNSTDMPAVLVETAFIDNLNNNKLLVNNKQEFADAISSGIIEYINNVYNLKIDEVTNDTKVYIDQVPKIDTSKKQITPEDIAKYVSQILIQSGVEGKFDDIAKSSKSLVAYPSIGCSQWLYDRADNILKKIPGGDKFVKLPYSSIINKGLLNELKTILASPESQKVQMEQLYTDCLEYVNDLRQIWWLDDTRCLIYASTWATTSISIVHKFVELCRGYGNIRSLLFLTSEFANKYRSFFDVDDKYQQGYFNRAWRVYNAVAELDLTTPFNIPEYGKGEFGK